MSFQKIGNILGYKFKSFEKGGDIEKQREAFEQGKQLFREGKVRLIEARIYFVKKVVSKTEWNSYYSQNSTYCPLQKDENGMWIGFCVVNQIPSDCQECEDEELRQIDLYRRANNLRPFPLKEVEQPLKLL